VRPDESRTVYDGKLVSVTLERWGTYEREIVEHPGAVAIVAVDADGCVTLVRQLREATVSTSVGARLQSGSHSGLLLELPAGTLKPGESPLDSARRELAEETGLTGGDWREATAFWTTPGFCRERMTLFFAEGVTAGEASPDEDESFELVRWPVGEIEARLGELEDAKTLAGLLLYLRDRGAPPS
jgi:ADP-ribose pyrophosphatase